MNKLKFSSQICTTKEQSQRLLELGLKPETADMYYFWLGGDNYYLKVDIDNNPLKYNMDKTYIPAWSLHRLIEILPSEIKQTGRYYSLTFDKDIIQYEDYDIYVLKSFEDNPCLYDNIVDCIEWLIKEDYFNKEHLKQ